MKIKRLLYPAGSRTAGKRVPRQARTGRGEKKGKMFFSSSETKGTSERKASRRLKAKKVVAEGEKGAQKE